MSITDNDRYLPADKRAEKNLKDVLGRHMPSKEAADELYAAITEYVQAVSDDLADRINKTGIHDPDW